MSTMLITRQNIAETLTEYLQHRLTLPQLVDWAERQVMDADFESPAARDAVAHLGLADVRAFGLTWEDCEALLQGLGYASHVEIVPNQSAA